jgi:putative hydrolase of the HAD superfamily
MLHICRIDHKKRVNIKTIIFDLGGVVINLDPDKTAAAFGRLTSLATTKVYEIYNNHPEVFLNYEKGLMSSEEFRMGVNEVFGAKMSDYEIDSAWNAMLLELPIGRLDLLLQLRKKYKVAILSNTNSIHVTAFNQTILEVSGKPDLYHFADEVYFSHDLKMRKPDIEIYEEVLLKSETNANESLFLDDTLANIECAKSIGIQTMHITHPDQIFNLKSYV